MKQISIRQFSFIVFLIVTASKLFMLPALLIKEAGRDAYLSVVLFLVVEWIVLLMIVFAAKRTDGNLYSLLDKGATKVGGRIIAALVLPALIIKALLILTELSVFFNAVLGQNMPGWMISASMCLLLFYIGTKTLRGIGRLSEVLTPIVLVATVVLISLAVGGVKLRLLLPLAQNGLNPVFKNALNYPFWFADLSVMLVFIGQIKFGKHFVKASAIAALAGAVAVMFFSVAVFAAYGDIPRLLSFFNTTDLLMYSPSGYIHGRFDLPVFCLRALASFVQLAVIFYCITRYAGYIIKSKKRITDVIISGVSAVALLLLIGAVFPNESKLLDFSGGFVRIFAVAANLALPVFVFITAFIINRKSKNKTEGLRLSMTKFSTAKIQIRKKVNAK